MAQSELADAVRHWIHFDNLTETINKQLTNTRNMRNQYEAKVLELMDKGGIKKSSIRVTGAILTCATRNKPTDLSWTFLEDQLHEYFRTRGGKDETKDVLGFLQNHRSTKTIEYLKKSSLTNPTTTTPPPAALPPK